MNMMDAPAAEAEVAVGEGSIENLNEHEQQVFLEDDLQEAIDMY